MPVEFLMSEQESKYGKYTSEPSQEQLAKYIMLDDQDRLFIFRHKGEHNHLGSRKRTKTAPKGIALGIGLNLGI